MHRAGSRRRRRYRRFPRPRRSGSDRAFEQSRSLFDQRDKRSQPAMMSGRGASRLPTLSAVGSGTYVNEIGGHIAGVPSTGGQYNGRA